MVIAKEEEAAKLVPRLRSSVLSVPPHAMPSSASISISHLNRG
jgi:hypothetical protein